jgi:hypothetical protein
LFMSCKGCLIMSYKMNIWTTNAKESAMCEGIKGAWTSCWCKPLFKKLLLQMDNFVKDNKNQHLFVIVIINSKGGLWRGLVGISCCWSYAWRHWWKFWLLVKEIEKAK